MGTENDPVTIRLPWRGNDSNAKTTLESSATMEVLNRYNPDVLPGNVSPRDAAKGVINEVSSNLG